MMERAKKSLLVQHEERFYIAHSKWPFTAYVYENTISLPHWHTYIELLYLLDGETEIQIGAKQYFGRPGDFYIINSNEVHHTLSCEPGKNFRHLVIQFDPGLIYPGASSMYEVKYILPFLTSSTNSYICIDGDSLKEIKDILNHILEEYEGRKPGYELEIKGCILRIFAWLVRNSYVDLLDEKPIEHLIEMKELLYYIEKHYQDSISLEMAAGMVSMSPSHFCRLFRKITGKTYVSYLNFIRLREAEKQLILTNDTVAEIAANVGFANVTYFNRIFKREYGLTPIALRKQNRSMIEEY